MNYNCKECQDKGFYLIKNAYDPSFSKKVPCEYCKRQEKSN